MRRSPPPSPLPQIGHWIIQHFDLSKYTESQLPRVKVSLAVVYACMGIIAACTAKFGVVAVAKFWLMPWLGYHFWMSLFTLVHHTAPHIPFRPKAEWDSAESQLGGTVHCEYPRWVEFLCHDISVHIPHHVSQKIPSYNLRAAHDSIMKNWGPYVNVCKINWRLVKLISTELHLYNRERNYVPFDAEQDKKNLWLQFQRALPPVFKFQQAMPATS